MNFINFNKTMLLGVLIFGLSTAGALAQDNDEAGFEPGKWKQRREEKGQQIYKQLNLTDEQKSALEANKSKNAEKRKAVFQQMRENRQALNQELMKPSPDMDVINAIHARLKTIQAEMADDRLNAILEVRKILTPDQFSQFIKIMDKKKFDRREFKEKQ